jgi:phosphoglycolate phosphatase
MKIKHIVFDFDGVIGDTFDILLSLSYKHATNNPSQEDFLAHHDGNVFEEPKMTFDIGKLHLFYSEYTEQISSSHLQASIEPITRLAQNFNLYINSSNKEAGLFSALKQAGIFNCFKKVMGAETHKSKVEKFKMIFDEYGASPENSVFITDTLGDIKEAEKMGLKTIAETFGFHSRERLMQGNPYKIADTWEEILEEIEKLSQGT